MSSAPQVPGVEVRGDWRGGYQQVLAPPAPGLVHRRVEITGPTDRKTVISTLDCDAEVSMADFEDGNALPAYERIG